MNIDELLTRGVAEIINEDSLKQKLESGKPLRIKYGVDPTKPDIHLGHAVILWKLKALQEMSHKIIFLIGDYTTKIGDPSGRNATRPVLSDEDIKVNAKTYFEQVAKILNPDKTEIRYNSEWYGKMSIDDLLSIAGKFSANQIIERDDFSKRFKEGSNVGLQELLYPALQAYDSVELKANVEIGGTDQKFNILAGRELQKKMEQSPQEVIFMDLLVGTDGKIKMSKSAGNYIAINDAPADMYGKVMSIPDEAMPQYFELCTDLEMPANDNPRQTKAQLAREIVKIYHGEEAANEAQEEFDRVYKNKEIPTDIPAKKITDDKMNIVDLMIEVELAPSKSEARRLVEQGAVEIAGSKIDDPNKEIEIENGLILQVGKHKFVKIIK